MKKTCKDCGREKTIASKGLCGTCYQRTRRRSLVTCEKCGLPRVHEAKGMCRSCYTKDYHKKNYEKLKTYKSRKKKYPTCHDCGKDFTKEFKHFADGFCRPCHPKSVRKSLKFEGSDFFPIGYVKEKLSHCPSCQVELTDENRKAKNFCKSCYGKVSKRYLSKTCLICHFELDSQRINPVCPNCRSTFRVIERLPDDLERRDMRLLLVKGRSGLLNEIDLFRTIHIYLSIVGEDDDLYSYSNVGVIQYCFHAFKSWISNPKITKLKTGLLWRY